MNNFIYHIPTKVYFGENQITNISTEITNYGKRVLLTYGGGSIKETGLYDKIIAQLKKANVEIFELANIAPNPRIDSVREGVKICKEHNVDVVLAVGGGSTIDASKFIAAGALVNHDPWDFFNSKQEPITKALPLLTVLTIAATGSEMDAGGVISNLETNEKLCRIEKPLLPKVSFLDPTITYSVSPYQTACGSADILSHIMEVYFNMSKGMYMLDSFMEILMKTIIKYTPIALKDPTNYEARANIMWASSWAINGFIDGGRAQEWSCHPIEHELSAFYDITHGHGLAIITPRFLEYCLDESTLPKYVDFAKNVFMVDNLADPKEIANEGIKRLSDFFFKTCALKSQLSDLNIDDSKIAIMAKKACQNNVIHGFKPLNATAIERILTMCL